VPQPGPAEEAFCELFDRVRRYFATYSAVGAIGGAEKGLARVCLMLARFEAGVVPEPGATAEQIHRSVPDDEVREMAGLVSGLRRALPGLLGHAGTPLPGVAEPVFAREQAEGDLMVGGTLVAVCLGDQAEVARRLRHLVAHAWLDAGDLYRVREAGVYLGAPGALVTWPVADLAAQLLSGADPDAARAEFRALAEREITVPRPAASADAAVRRGRPATAPPQGRPARKPDRATPATGVYGPEAWDIVAGAEWTYWDLWFSVVSVADCRGDWDALDARFYAKRYSNQFAEPMWSHLVDLKGRLAAAGITAADLVGDLADDRKTIKKARSKVLEWTGIRDQDHSPAMDDIPSGRYTFRAHFGSWDLYPVSPRPFYEQLAAASPFDLEAPGWGLPTSGNITPLFTALEELEASHAKDPSTLLAVRRAGLTVSSLAHHRCDVSYGDLGEKTMDATLRFSRTDWRATGIEPAVFWRDVLEVFTVLANCAVAYKHKNELMASLGAGRDKALIKQVVDDLHASYVSGRLDWPARQLKRLWESV
jgi:hypothetical protein